MYIYICFFNIWKMLRVVCSPLRRQDIKFVFVFVHPLCFVLCLLNLYTLVGYLQDS
jgi:hypothetical protein